MNQWQIGGVVIMIEIFKSTVEPPNGEKLRKFNNV